MRGRKSMRGLVVAGLILVGGCFQDSTPAHSTFLPLDYQTTFQKVRSCEFVQGHDNHYELVFMNTIAADPYSAAVYPLPAGSVVVAEQHSDPSCSSLGGYKLMAKEKAGYDSVHNDWRWQQLDANQRVLQDGKLSTCATCHGTMPSCNDYLCTP